MASLQTLRNKGGIIVSVIIGLALLAFLLGDFLSSGSRLFGASRQNVGEIDGTTINYQKFSQEVAYLSDIQKISSGGQSANTEEQNEALRSQAWEQFIRQYALKPSLSEVGLTITTDEMTQLMGGAHTSPMIAQMFANPQTGLFDREYFANFVSNIKQDPSGQLTVFWNYLQTEVADNSLIMKFKSLVDKAAYVTSFEASKIAKFESDSYSVSFVASQFSSIPDSTVSVSASEIKAFYDKYPDSFKEQTSRSIDYVVFDAQPSEADRLAADKYIRELATEFQQNSTPLQFASVNSQSAMDSRYYSEGQMSGDLGKFAFSATTDQIYGPELIGDQYTLARISDVKIMPDSVNFSHIVLLPGQKNQADSIADVIRKQNNFAAMAAEFSQDSQTKEKGGLIGSIDPQTMPEQFSAPLLKAKKGDLFVVETPQSIHLIKVNEVRGEGKKVQLATIKYTVEASNETRSATYAKANSFATEAHNGFDAAISSQSLVKRVAVIRPFDREINGLRNSREAVRWAFDNQAKEVSKVMEFGDTFIVATLTNVTEEGKAPLKSVEQYIKSQLIAQKKGEILAAKMVGATSLETLSGQLSSSIIEAEDVNFNTYIVPQVGLDLAFAGGVCAMNPTSLSKPIVGNMGVYVAKINATASEPLSVEVVKARLNAEAQQNAFYTAYQAFLQASNIKDLRYRFF